MIVLKVLGYMADVLMGFYSSTFSQTDRRIQFRSRPMRFLGFSNHGKGASRQDISKLSTVCSTFSRSGWSVVSIASLAKGSTSKKRPSLHVHKFPARSHEASPRTFQTAFILFTSNLSSSIIHSFSVVPVPLPYLVSQ
jgi:hypothetical protein